MKKNVQFCLFLLLIALAWPRFSFAQSEKRIMEYLCQTRPALKEVLLSGGVSATLMGDGPYTFFSPSDEALAALSSTDPVKLNNLLLNHIVAGKILTQDLKDGSHITTMGGSSLSVIRKRDKVLINGVEITEADVTVKNGVIHTVRGWLVSPVAQANGIGQLK